MDLALDLLSWLSLGAGSFFCLVGAVGLLRMPDFYSRTHAAGVTDSLGMPLILLGCALQAGWSLIAMKLGFIAFFVLVTSPTAAHALVKAAYKRGSQPVADRPGRHQAGLDPEPGQPEGQATPSNS